MFIERPPLVYRLLYKGALWRAARHTVAGQPVAYLTFDDGPTPQATPAVLETLAAHGVPATFFTVGDNARRYPHLLRSILDHGHTLGNHTMHHLQGLFTPVDKYMRDVEEARKTIGETRFFRPPHGFLRPSQYRILSRQYRIVMQDVVSRDYNSSLSPEKVVEIVLKNVRPGSIIVFHDSERSAANVTRALPTVIEKLKEKGYVFGRLPG